MAGDLRGLFRGHLRTLFDVVPLDAGIVRGSHGLAALDPRDRPILIGHGRKPGIVDVPMASVAGMILEALELS